MSVAFAQPLAVVPDLELAQRQAQLLHGVEGPNPEQLFLEGADEPFGHAIALGLPHEGGLDVIPRNFNSSWK